LHSDVIIIGAGASGLFCALQCAKRGRTVLVLDHADRIGSKIRISGGGRCNFTNLRVSADYYFSHNPHFCKSALAGFTPQDILSFVQDHGITYYEKEEGQIFCVNSSRDVIDMLEQECVNAGVKTILQCAISSVTRKNEFIVETNKGTFSSESLIIATGGLSYPVIGASSFGYDIARSFGIAITDLRPALVPFVLSDQERSLCNELAGVSLDAVITYGRRKFKGSLLFTHRGLSGPAALQTSLFYDSALPLSIDLVPDANIYDVLMQKRKTKAEIQNLLAEYVPKRLAKIVCDRLDIAKPINQISDKDIRSLADSLHAWKVIPKGTEGYETAEVTAGGVDTKELSSKTMEAKKQAGLFFIGEVVDVTGALGGYNLHWAWASGYAAGKHA